jgi:2-oxoglutarate ferredoxin oxidoreductase subunit delta
MPGDAVTEVQTQGANTGASPISVDTTLCKACGICVGLCPRDVLAEGPDGVVTVVRPDECTACRICELHCPDFAIAVRQTEKHRARVQARKS